MEVVDFATTDVGDCCILFTVSEPSPTSVATQ